MLRKDWLLRQIEMLAALIHRLLQLREAGDEQGAVEEIETSYHDLFGLDPRLIGLLPAELLIDKLKSGEFVDATKGITLAILLREDAANHLSQGSTFEHYQRLLRSLQVFLASVREQEVAPELESLYDIDSVLNDMNAYVLPAEVQYALFQYYEDTAQYARAEDVLLELLESSEERKALLEESAAYYEWLLTLSDEELLQGNLPRTEVLDGLAQLSRYTPDQT